MLTRQSASAPCAASFLPRVGEFRGIACGCVGGRKHALYLRPMKHEISNPLRIWWVYRDSSSPLLGLVCSRKTLSRKIAIFRCPHRIYRISQTNRRTRQFMCRAQASEAYVIGVSYWRDGLIISILFLSAEFILSSLSFEVCADRLHARYELPMVVRSLLLVSQIPGTICFLMSICCSFQNARHDARLLYSSSTLQLASTGQPTVKHALQNSCGRRCIFWLVAANERERSGRRRG